MEADDAGDPAIDPHAFAHVGVRRNTQKPINKDVAEGGLCQAQGFHGALTASCQVVEAGGAGLLGRRTRSVVVALSFSG